MKLTTEKLRDLLQRVSAALTDTGDALDNPSALWSGPSSLELYELRREVDDAACGLQREAEVVAAPAPKTLPRETLVSALRTIALSDKTAYEHHEKRYQDGKLPETVGGTIWLTPRVVALRTLEAMGEETESLYWPFTTDGQIPWAPARKGEVSR